MPDKRKKVTRADVKPSRINVGDHLYDTFGNCEREIVAKNIIIVCQRLGDDWRPFTAAEYVATCGHPEARMDIGYLDGFVRDRYMSKVDNAYTVEDTFVQAVAAYIKR